MTHISELLNARRYLSDMLRDLPSGDEQRKAAVEGLYRLDDLALNYIDRLIDTTEEVLE